jgi:hypothetical protein
MSADIPNQNLEVSDIPQERAMSLMKEFLTDYFSRLDETQNTYSTEDINIGSFLSLNIEAIKSGDFTIDDFRIYPSIKSSGIRFQFYIQGSEFHIDSKAAQVILDRL